MIPRIALHIIIILFTVNSLQAQLDLSTTRTDRMYDVGEEMNFILTNPIDTVVEYDIIFGIRTSPIESGKVNLKAGVPTYIPFTLHEPGVAMLATRDTSAMNVEYVGASFAPFNIGIYEECPADFDSFWATQKTELAAIPIDPELTLIDSTEQYKSYKINLATIDNRRVYGFITIPIKAGPHPAILTLPPAGNGVGVAEFEPSFTQNYDAISMSISIHNADPDEVDPNAGFPDNPNIREEYFYKTAILAGVRAVDYIFSRSDFDGQTMVVTGNSQGGGLTLCVTGIDQRISLISVANPAFCEHAAFKYSRASGFPYYNVIAAFNNPENIDEAVYQASMYYDAKYFTQRIKVPCLVVSGYKDNVCPSSSVFAAINQLHAPKVFAHATRLGHEAPDQYWTGRVNFYVKHLPAFANSTIGIYRDTDYFVDVGPNTSGSINQAISITGATFFNDIPNTTWPVKWDLVSGPGSAQFSNASQRTTTVLFDQAGTYILRFTADSDDFLATEGTLISVQDYLEVTID